MRTSDTLGGLIDRGYQLWLYCEPPWCGRKLKCDVYDLAKQFGPETVWVAKRWPVKCARCGNRRVSMLTPGESRPAETVKREGPDNIRASRTDAERAEALAMIAPDERAKFGL